VGAREQPARAAPVPSAPATPVPSRPDPIPTVMPALSPRGQIAELSGSLALAAVLAGLLSMLCAALIHTGDLNWIGLLFFATVAICWGVLIPAKFWTTRPSDSWMRRVVMMGMGVLIGAGSLWLNGWTPQSPSLDTTASTWPETAFPNPWLLHATR